MTRRGTAGSRLTGGIRRAAYQIFYRLPASARRRLVRLVAPTYTVGSVILVRHHDGRLLLVRQPPGLGWSLPGGMVDRGEDPAECAVRELAEETGLVVGVEDLSPAVPNAVPHLKGRWIDFVYEVRLASGEHPLTVDGAEVLEARWYGEQSLPPLTVPAARLLAHFGLGPYRGYPEVTSR